MDQFQVNFSEIKLIQFSTDFQLAKLKYYII